LVCGHLPATPLQAMGRGKDKAKVKKDAEKDAPPSVDITPHPSPASKKAAGKRCSAGSSKKQLHISSSEEEPEIGMDIVKKKLRKQQLSDSDVGEESKSNLAAPCTKEDFQNLRNILAKSFCAMKSQQEAVLAQG
jgi:hypothetical protein